jgi:hypothetical protein
LKSKYFIRTIRRRVESLKKEKKEKENLNQRRNLSVLGARSFRRKREENMLTKYHLMQFRFFFFSVMLDLFVNSGQAGKKITFFGLGPDTILFCISFISLDLVVQTEVVQRLYLFHASRVKKRTQRSRLKNYTLVT